MADAMANARDACDVRLRVLIRFSRKARPTGKWSPFSTLHRPVAEAIHDFLPRGLFQGRSVPGQERSGAGAFRAPSAGFRYRLV